ncbi:putative N-(5'-phosphoribosyl)anthranilate isomerase [Kyrpidia spormannii]|uniref:N-(5'-phosphoribosyl)anthranilate isomerase n=1 Tax=Kyrpidia spormannii TaxID=2055160 RepID=A0A6F9E838_9BACL|nr:phosphoribosylanthranilate isomerase [Kyrpidia spormannii]CAB3392998.1 putative N-(5'-phosphoribosyl)anthranilate isomerase [Kyrpidia spormannii]
MTTIKACGFTRAEDVAAAERLGVDWIGLVFAPSKRRVEVEQAARLRAGTRLRCMGVFVDAGIEKVRETARRVGLDGVQLHGVESPEDCRRLRDEGLFVVKAFSALLERPGAAAAYKGRRRAGANLSVARHSRMAQGCRRVFFMDRRGVTPGECSGIASGIPPGWCGCFLGDRDGGPRCQRCGENGRVCSKGEGMG